MDVYEGIKQQLQAVRKDLTEKIKRVDHYGLADSLPLSNGELSQYDNHPADSATDLYEREKDLALYERLEDELEEVEHALNKFENKTYGVCERTGKLIPFERLQAFPTARTTVEAAHKRVGDDRPVEEEILETFDKFNFDDEPDNTQFDAEDSWQSVAQFNELPMVFEDSSLDRTSEHIGYVEELEGFITTDIHGYRGDEQVDFVRNIHYDQYLNDKYEDGIGNGEQ